MLLGVLRNELDLTSVRQTCGVGVCGACTALVDGEPISACITLAPLVDGCEITTVEGLGGEHPVQQAFVEAGAFQCGYCTPGMILTAKRLLEETSEPTGDEIKNYLGGNLCRCGCYVKIADARDPRRRLEQDGRGGQRKSMRLVTYEAGAGPRVGALEDGIVADLGFDGDMVSFIEAGAPVGDTTLVENARLLAPLIPRSLRDFLAFEGHLKNAFARLNRPIPEEWYEVPAFYKGMLDTVIGPEDTVPWPSSTPRNSTTSWSWRRSSEKRVRTSRARRPVGTSSATPSGMTSPPATYRVGSFRSGWGRRRRRTGTAPTC